MRVECLPVEPQAFSELRLGSAGGGLRWGLWPFGVVRLDLGYRFGSGFAAYGLPPNWWEGSYLQLWFGFDY